MRRWGAALVAAFAALGGPAGAGDSSVRSTLLRVQVPQAGDFTLARFHLRVDVPAGGKRPELGLTVQMRKGYRLPDRLTAAAVTTRLEEPGEFLVSVAAALREAKAGTAEDVARQLGLQIIDQTNGERVIVVKQSAVVDVLSKGAKGSFAVFNPILNPGDDLPIDYFEDRPPTQSELEWLRRRDEAVREITARAFLAGLVHAARALSEQRAPSAAFIRKYVDAAYKGGSGRPPVSKPGAVTLKLTPFLEWTAVERTDGKGCAAGRVTLETKTVTLDPPTVKNNVITPGEKTELSWTKRVCVADRVRAGLDGRFLSGPGALQPGSKLPGTGITYRGHTLLSSGKECFVNKQSNPAAGCVYKLTLRLQNNRDPVPG